LNEKIHLCRVDLSACVEHYLPGLPCTPDAWRRGPVRITTDMPIARCLTPSELETVNGFKALKRQVEWLGGRLAVKHVVPHALSGSRLPLFVHVDYHPRGAPFVDVAPELCLSITHAHRFAAAAISADDSLKLGIDLERNEGPKTPSFWQIAFSPTERRHLAGADTETLYRSWTLKEACLKWLGMGFRENLHAVEVIDAHCYHHGRPLDRLNVLTRRWPGDHVVAAVWGDQISDGSA